jgi:hypothetical protein
MFKHFYQVDCVKPRRQTNSPVDATLRHALRSTMAVIRPSSEQIMMILLKEIKVANEAPFTFRVEVSGVRWRTFT